MPDPSLSGPSADAAAATALRISERRYRRLFETARDGILLLDGATGAILDANPFAADLLGVPSRDELIGTALWDVGLLPDRDACLAALARLEREGVLPNADLSFQNRRGERRDVEFGGSLHREDGTTVIAQCHIRDIAERAALAAKLREAQEKDRTIARALQRAMLFKPEENAFSGLLVQTAYAMASDEALVGGDFWDTFAYDHGHVAMVLGDVMGHGLTSAIFTTELQHTMRGYIREHEQPERILYRMNKFIYQSNRLFVEGINTEGSDAPVCLAIAVIERETGAGTLAIAGMEPPIIVRADGRAEQSAAVGLPLGIEPDEDYPQVAFQLEPGDTLILTTDGIPEARHGNEFLDIEGMTQLAVEGNNGTLKEMADTILNGAIAFAGGKLRDDAAIILVRRAATSPHIPPKGVDP